MTHCVLWQCPCDGRRHLALIPKAQETSRVHALCGKAIDSIHFANLFPDGEVTCPSCRTEDMLAMLVKNTAA